MRHALPRWLPEYTGGRTFDRRQSENPVQPRVLAALNRFPDGARTMDLVAEIGESLLNVSRALSTAHTAGKVERVREGNGYRWFGATS